jgi:hypothetical protein
MRVEHDQFYTNPDIARACMDILRRHVDQEGPWIEPSAGTGAFLDLVPHAIGYDIDPKNERIQKADFLTVQLPENCIIFGNPPFGRQASLATRFIRHAAPHAQIIAFILPRSFSKPSMQRAFPLDFHMEECWSLPKDAFVANGEPYNVPAVFQIWKRRTTTREIPEIELPVGFAYVKKNDPHDLVFRRVGGRAGLCFLPSPYHNPQCFYFVKLDDSEKTSTILHQSLLHEFPTNTTGPRSLSKAEATAFLNTCIANTTP